MLRISSTTFMREEYLADDFFMLVCFPYTSGYLNSIKGPSAIPDTEHLTRARLERLITIAKHQHVSLWIPNLR